MQRPTGSHRSAELHRSPLLGILAAIVCFWLGGVSCSTSKECAGENCGVQSCDDSLCGNTSRCVNSLCRPACSSDAQCLAGDACRRILTDYGTEGSYCFGPTLTANPYLSASGDSQTGGNSAACKQNSDCLSSPTQACVEGSCLTLCQIHAHCGTAGNCSGEAKDVDGNAVLYCKPDAAARAAGQYGSTCFRGTHACDSANDFFCTGLEGDSNSYCTQKGCAADADCPTGYACRYQRETTPPCESQCGLQGDATAVGCIPSSDIGAGRPYRCNDNGKGLWLKACERRSFCDDCETDADCRSSAGQVCAKGADGRRSCSQLCSSGTHSCPWGSATECKVYDQELGQATCGHRFGSCRGSGKSCEPCVDDHDCAQGFCATSSYTGEHFCVDISSTCSCKTGEKSCLGGGCPLSPSGSAMNCIARAANQAPDVCYGSLSEPSNSSSTLACWPAE